MLPYFDDISTAYIDHRASDALGGVDDDIVVLGHVKSVQSLDLLPRSIQYTLINRIRHAIIYELRQNQPVFAIVKHFECVGREWQPMSDIGISSQDGVDVSCEFRPLILIDSVCDIGRRTLDLYSPSNTALGLMSRCGRRFTTLGSTAQTSNPATWYIVLGWRCLLAADLGDKLAHESSQSIVQPIGSFSDQPVCPRLDVHRHSHPALPSSSCPTPPL